MTPEGLDEPPRGLAKALHERGVPGGRFQTVAVGESVTVERSRMDQAPERP